MTGLRDHMQYRLARSVTTSEVADTGEVHAIVNQLLDALPSGNEIARFFDRLELLAPGVVSCSLWRPDPGQLGAPVEVDLFGGIGRKS